MVLSGDIELVCWVAFRTRVPARLGPPPVLADHVAEEIEDDRTKIALTTRVFTVIFVRKIVRLDTASRKSLSR